MSERFEKFVKDHREGFDILEPNAALWGKIESRLDKNRKRSFSILWKAAAVAIVFGFSFWAQMQLEDTPQVATSINISKDSSSGFAQIAESNQNPVTETEKNENTLLPEFAETEKYYSRRVSSTMKELKVYLVKYPDVAHDMKKDLAELDSVYHALKRDLGDNVAQEEILSAMIQNYRMKLQILEDIKNELMQNTAIKTKNNNEAHVY